MLISVRRYILFNFYLFRINDKEEIKPFEQSGDS